MDTVRSKSAGWRASSNIEQDAPGSFPGLPEGRHGGYGNGLLELSIAVASGLFAVRGQEIGEAGAQVAHQVLHDNGGAVAAGGGLVQPLRIGELSQGAVGEGLVSQEILAKGGQ